MGVNLKLLEEPIDLKKKIKQVRDIIRSDPTRDEATYDNLAVWGFNDFPKYLWDNWKDELRKHGYTWQKFLGVLKLASGDVVLWAIKDALPWDELLNRIIRLLEIYTGENSGRD